MEEGVRMDIGENSGPPALSFAGHGRTWAQPDGTWAMVFSGNLWGDRNPSDIMLAASEDGLEWQVIDACVANNGHDPTVLRLTDGRIAMIYAYLRESILVRLSDDGIMWGEPQILELLDEDGGPITEFHGDVALMRRPDGGLRLMSNHPEGIASFIPIATDVADKHLNPTSFILHQNTPNPFNPQTAIGWQGIAGSPIKIAIYNAVGQKIRTLLYEDGPNGAHSVIWDGIDAQGNPVPSGVYLYRISVDGSSTQTKKMLLMK
jgi:hypothetical protein